MHREAVCTRYHGSSVSMASRETACVSYLEKLCIHGICSSSVVMVTRGAEGVRYLSRNYTSQMHIIRGDWLKNVCVGNFDN